MSLPVENCTKTLDEITFEQTEKISIALLKNGLPLLRTKSRCYWSSSVEGLAINCKLSLVFLFWIFNSSFYFCAYFRVLELIVLQILQGIDHLRSSLGGQMQKPNLQTQNQLLLASHQQQVLAQAQAQSNLGNSANYGDLDLRRPSQLPRGSLNAKDSQSMRNDGSICSPVQSSSPKV